MALLYQSNLSNSFWGECVLCATYLINRMPLSCLNNISTYHILLGTIPNTDHLRAFGCLCFFFTIKQGRTKFKPIAVPCVFIGYPYGQKAKAYKVYNLNTKKFIVSRGIVFYEKHFPFDFEILNLLFLFSTCQLILLLFMTLHMRHKTTKMRLHLMQPTPRLVTTMARLIKPTLHGTYTTPNKAYTIPNAGTYVTPNKEYPTLNNSNETNLHILTVHTTQNNVESTLDINENDNNTFLEPKRYNISSHLFDYVCNNSIWCNLISFSTLPNQSQVFLTSQAKCQSHMQKLLKKEYGMKLFKGNLMLLNKITHGKFFLYLKGRKP